MYLEEFKRIMTSDKNVMAILRAIAPLNMPNWYVGASFVPQTVWNYLGGHPPFSRIKDLDIVYYDKSDLTSKTEREFANKSKKALKEFPIEVDVVNEARVHIWYEREFGKKIPAYTSCENAIDNWPTTASAIGINLLENGDLNVYAPFGLKDLMNRIVRPNKRQVSREVYEEKSSRWKRNLPELTVIKWLINPHA